MAELVKGLLRFEPIDPLSNVPLLVLGPVRLLIDRHPAYVRHADGHVAPHVDGRDALLQRRRGGEVFGVDDLGVSPRRRIAVHGEAHDERGE